MDAIASTTLRRTSFDTNVTFKTNKWMREKEDFTNQVHYFLIVARLMGSTSHFTVAKSTFYLQIIRHERCYKLPTNIALLNQLKWVSPYMNFLIRQFTSAQCIFVKKQMYLKLEVIFNNRKVFSHAPSKKENFFGGLLNQLLTTFDRNFNV